MSAPSFATPQEALAQLQPDLAKQFDAIEAAIRLLAEAAGLEGAKDHVSLLPDSDWPLTHQLAGSAVCQFVLRKDPTLKPGQVIKQVAVANPWFSETKFARYTNRIRNESRAAETQDKPVQPPKRP